MAAPVTGDPSDEDGLPSITQILASVCHFTALGLPRARCTPAEVKSRYKSLALRVHPDKCGDPRAKEAFQRVSEAFDALHSPDGQARHLRDTAGGPRARSQQGRGRPRARGEGQPEAAGPAQGGRAWWDAATWAEFERRFRRREQMEAALRAKYMTHVQGKYQHRRLRMQVVNAERSCEQLDRQKDLGESELWPPEFREERYNKSEMQVAAFEGAKTAWDELLERQELEDPEHCAGRLADLLTHLRVVHVYCLHCGCHFDDAADLERSCPGFDEEAHENAESMAMRSGGEAAPHGVARELAPPPKRQRAWEVPLDQCDEDDVDDPLNALLVAGTDDSAAGRSEIRQR